MKKFKKKAIIDENYCVACGSCAKVCPLQIIHIDQGVIAKINYNKCIGCGLCTTQCEFDAIKLTRDIPEGSNMVRSEDKMKVILPYAAKRQIKILRNKKK